MNRIKQLRKDKNMTLVELGEKVNLPKGTLSRYENGGREPKEITWQALADFFNVSVDYLKGYGYSKDYIYKQLDDAYKEPYTKDYEIEPPFTNPVLSAKEEIENIVSKIKSVSRKILT